MGNFMLLGNFILNGIKNIVFLIDQGVYTLAQMSYNVFRLLASGQIFDQDVFRAFAERVYLIVGVVMVFVLAFNILTYIVDPDKISDKKSGATATIKNIIITLFILMIIPTAFVKLYQLQDEILNSQVIENLILGGYDNGNTGTGTSSTDTIDQGVNNMVANAFSAFFHPTGFSPLKCNSTENSGESGDNETVDDDKNTYQPYCNAYASLKQNGDLNEAYGDYVTSNDYTYNILISTAAGIVLVFFLLSFALDLAVRVAKLAVLQLIAPVPVLLELVPGKQGTRGRWIKEVLSTWGEVFIKLAVVYFAVLVISLIPNAVANILTRATGVTGIVDIMCVVLLIFGILKFAKEAPKLICDILGIKSMGVIKAAGLRGLAMAGWAANTVRGTIGNTVKGFQNTPGGIKNKLANAGISGLSTLGRSTLNARNVHSFKDSNALNKRISANVAGGLAKRNSYIFEHGNTIGGALKGLGADTISGASQRLGVAGHGIDSYKDQRSFEQNKIKEQYNKGYQQLYKEKISSVWNNDSEYQAYEAELRKAKATGASTTTIEANMKARQQKLITQNAAKLAEGAGFLNNYIATHQGVDGIPTANFDISDVMTKAAAGEREFFDGNTAGGIGNSKELSSTQTKALNNDQTYQKQLVAEKVEADRREQVKKAAEANQNKDKK